MLIAATARIASRRGNRGLPGGGSSAGERGTARRAYACPVRRLSGFEARLAAIALLAPALRGGAAVVTNDPLLQGDAMTLPPGAPHLPHGPGFRQPLPHLPP